jgi:RNA polymerase sigma-70 factor (ECF subfamily)
MQDDRMNEILSALMRRVAAGDGEAFRELYQLTVPILFSYARRALRERADAEEIVCDVYLQAWQNAGHYDAERSSVVTWLIVICRTRAIDRHRYNRARTCAVPRADPPAADAGPCDLVSALQSGSAMRSAIERLSPLRRQLLALAFFDELSHSQIAAATELAEGTVKSHIRRALATLRQNLPALA